MIELTLTKKSNVDYDKGTVIDAEQIFTRDFPNDEKVIIAGKVSGCRKEIFLMHVSLYEHCLVLDDEEYQILHMKTVSHYWPKQKTEGKTNEEL